MNGTKNTHFVGIYFSNQYASRVDISRVDGSTTDSVIKFKTIGGNLDFYVFNGQQYEDVLMQYSDLIGKPKMLPYWAHGFHVRTAAFKSEETIKEALTQYQALGFPLQGISLTEDALQGSYNFNFSELAKNVTADFPNATMVYPFTYLVPSDTPADLMVNESLTVMSNMQNDTLLANLSNGKQAMCLDPFNPDLSDGYLKPMFAKQNPSVVSDRATFWLDRNMPTLAGPTNLTTDNKTTNPFFNLPFIPGAVPLA